MVHEARKVVTAIMGNCPRRTVPQWRISLPLTTDCPNTSCSPRRDNERPLSGSGSLYSFGRCLSASPVRTSSFSIHHPRFLYFPLTIYSRRSLTVILIFSHSPPCRRYPPPRLCRPRNNPLTSLQICTRIMLSFCSNLLPPTGDDRFWRRVGSGAGTLGIRLIRDSVLHPMILDSYLFMLHIDAISSDRGATLGARGIFGYLRAGEIYV